jgi:hypothetical protein
LFPAAAFERLLARNLTSKKRLNTTLFNDLGGVGISVFFVATA